MLNIALQSHKLYELYINPATKITIKP